MIQRSLIRSKLTIDFLGKIYLKHRMTTVIESLNKALRSALEKDEKVLIIGEDILDPYGGAFKVTQGLSTDFPGQVLTTPVSESGIVGVASGMALRGFRPVVEIMFGDFITLAADQLINHASKFRYMYNDQVRVPIVIRTPMGGRRGYGPTHSQTIEKLFFGVPGLSIYAPNIFTDPGDLLNKIIFESDDPVLFIENKIQYTQDIVLSNGLDEFNWTIIDQDKSDVKDAKKDFANPIQLSLRDSPEPIVTIATYGYMADLCQQAALRLAYEEEIFVEITVFSQLLPVTVSALRSSLLKTHRLVVVEEGTITSGWGTEIIASSLEQLGEINLRASRVASKDSPIPAAINLEQDILPDVDEIIMAVKMMV